MGQNVRLASKLVGWDIDVMTREELDQQLDSSVRAFSTIPELSEDLAESLVSQGFFSFEDLSVIEPDHLQELSGLPPEECDKIVAQAEVEAEREEQEAKVRKAADKAEREAANGRPSDKKPTTKKPAAPVEEAVISETAEAEATAEPPAVAAAEADSESAGEPETTEG